MRDLVVFFQSLQAPANPIQNPRRVLDDALGTLQLPAPALGMPSSAVQGQRDFQLPTSFNQKTCSECHPLQSGSDGSQMTEGTFLRAPRSMAIEMAHLRQLYLRSPKVVSLDPNDGAHPLTFNQNGFGTFHDGRFPSMLHFVFDNFDTMPTQERVNTFRFVEQFDQGIAPAVHWAERYAQDSPAAVETEIAEILLAGAALDKRWNDVVAIGRFNTGSGWRPMQWVYRPEVGRFAPSQPGIASLNWTQMKNVTHAGNAENIFIGVPFRNGRRIGIDFDNDGLINGRELELGTNPLDPDTDKDGWPDGYENAYGDDPLVPQATSSDHDRPALVEAELDFANSRLAKYHVRFGEPVKYAVTYSTPGGPVHTFTRDYFSSADTFVLTHEEPSTESIPFVLHDPVFNAFDVDIVLTDRNGLTRGPIHLAPFTADFVHSRDNGGTGFNLHVASMAWTRSDRLREKPNAAITLDAEVRIKLDSNYGAPLFTLLDNFESPPKSGIFPLRAQNKMVFCSVAVRRAGSVDFEKSTTIVTPLATEFTVRRSPPRTEEFDYQVDPGKPWICAPLTDANETTTISFQQPGLFPGDEVKLSVMGVLTPVPGSNPVVYAEASLQELQPLLLEDSMELTLQL
jgi:hypothetical protein